MLELATIFIPTMLQEITHGIKKLELDARNVRQVVDELEKAYRGFKNGCWMPMRFARG